MSQLTEEVKSRVKQLLLEGKEVEARDFLQQEFGISDEDAGRLLTTLRETEFHPIQDAGKLLRSRSSGCVVTILRAFAIILCFFAFGFLLGAIVIYATNEYMVSHGRRVDGTVVAFNQDGQGAAPIVSYEDQTGVHQVKGETHSNPPDYAVGEHVTLYVDRDNPEKGLIDSFAERWLFVVIMGGVSLFFLIPAFILFFVARKINRKG